LAAPLLASLVVGHVRDNILFEPGTGPNGGDYFLPWRQLREGFLAHGVLLNTPDVNAGKPVQFELHLNARRKLPADVPCYTFLYEDPLVRPLNADRAQLGRYRLVFTWNDELIDHQRFLRLDYPNALDSPPGAYDDAVARPLHSVMIASNKALLRPDPRNLHARRVEVIRAFERDAPELFHLYGRGWDQPPVRPGHWGRILKRLQQWRARWQRGKPAAARPFPSYRGAVHTKDEVLLQARFAIAFENSRGSPGYVSEKIFDCLRCGCIPVYIGPPNMGDCVPGDCYVDGDRFDNAADLVRHLRDMPGEVQARYRQAMQAFLHSPRSRRYSNEHFCTTLVDAIVGDLALR
jgi:hypothetical protein